MPAAADSRSAAELRRDAIAHYRARQPAAALDAWSCALALGMDPAADAGERWQCAMLLGRFEAAWRISDLVLAGRRPADADAAGVPAHRRFVWDGSPLAGRSVLVRCYHGLGDTIQFVRCAQMLRRIARDVTVQAQPELVPLLGSAAGIDRLVPLDWRAPDPPHDAAIELMELPHALRITRADLPGRIPYLAPPAERIRARGRALPKRRRPRVGLAWASGDWDPRRSLPLAQLQPLADLPRIAWFSLQRGGAEAALDGGCGPKVENPTDHGLEILDTAALIANLDLVVSVDGMVAHLAGAMGKPVWLLLHHGADWRWLIAGETSPWYPTTRLFRQPTPGDWATPVAGIAQRLSRAF